MNNSSVQTRPLPKSGAIQFGKIKQKLTFDLDTECREPVDDFQADQYQNVFSFGPLKKQTTVVWPAESATPNNTQYR